MKRVVFAVISIHLFFLFYLALFVPEKKQQKRPIKVNTFVKLPPKKPAIKKVAAMAPAVKKQAKRAAPRKKRPVLKKKIKPKVPHELLKKLQQNLAKIEKAPSKTSSFTPLKAPKSIPKLQVEKISGEGDALFATTLVDYLQKALDLPSFGKVRVALTLSREGRFIKMTILGSESDHNRLFLQNELKVLKYPKFTGSLAKEKEHTFVITFCND